MLLFTCYFSVENVFLFLNSQDLPLPLNHTPFSLLAKLFIFAVPSLDCSSLLYFGHRLCALVTRADYVGLSSFGPYSVCGQGQLWPFLSEQGATDVERQAGRSSGKKIKRLVPQK